MALELSWTVTSYPAVAASETQPTKRTLDRWLSMLPPSGILATSVQRHSATGNHDYTSSVSAMLLDLEWPTLKQRCQHSRLTMLYTIYRPTTA